MKVGCPSRRLSWFEIEIVVSCFFQAWFVLNHQSFITNLFNSKNMMKLSDLLIFYAGDKGEPDCCIFDFTNLYAARVAARVTVAILLNSVFIQAK